MWIHRVVPHIDAVDDKHALSISQRPNVSHGLCPLLVGRVVTCTPTPPFADSKLPYGDGGLQRQVQTLAALGVGFGSLPRAWQ